jgi:hypothetical protein
MFGSLIPKVIPSVAFMLKPAISNAWRERVKQGMALMATRLNAK